MVGGGGGTNCLDWSDADLRAPIFVDWLASAIMYVCEVQVQLTELRTGIIEPLS